MIYALEMVLTHRVGAYPEPALFRFKQVYIKIPMFKIAMIIIPAKWYFDTLSWYFDTPSWILIPSAGILIPLPGILNGSECQLLAAHFKKKLGPKGFLPIQNLVYRYRCQP